MKIADTARKLILACSLIGAVALPASASANSAAADYFSTRMNHSAVPTLLTRGDREYYNALFNAIERKDWTVVQTMFSTRQDGPLHPQAQAEYYLDANSPRIELNSLSNWLQSGTHLPQAAQISRLAVKRGATAELALPGTQRFFTIPQLPKRTRPRSINDGTMPQAISAGILDAIKQSNPLSALQMLDGIEASLSAEANTEWRQRVAWSFYISNDDKNAYRQAQFAAQGTGPWVYEAWWTAGLAAWRLDDCEGAIDAFGKAANPAANPELLTASLYWQSRALVRCRRPEDATKPLIAAARYDETLYGMLAAEQLGLRLPTRYSNADFTQADWQSLRDIPNVRAAVELAEIGQAAMADTMLRHQAKIGNPAQYAPLTRLARDLGLPLTQLWMAYNAPVGGEPDPALRFPTPKWVPVGGWSVDPALVYAHTLQESVFQTTVTSPAGARGLMQIMPGTNREYTHIPGNSGSVNDLNNPEVNLAVGQEHLNKLQQNSGTQGLLPKVIAAYNAGIAPVARWNTEIQAKGDPLLWMESIPYWETRGYVSTVMRNYWMYERQAGGPSESRIALAQTMWPTFPRMTGSLGMRMAANGALLRGH